MSTDSKELLHVWLGIPASEASPSHYRLLGLPELENDPAAITFVSGWRLAYVESRIDLAGEAGLGLLQRLKRARLDLVDTKQKAIYDRQLRQRRPELVLPHPPIAVDDARRWLGVREDPQQKPSDRELLGISDNESNLAVVKAQFDQRMAGLRAFEKVCVGEEQLRIAQLIARLAKAERRVVKSLAASSSGTGNAEVSDAGGESSVTFEEFRSSDSIPEFPVRDLKIDRSFAGPMPVITFEPASTKRLSALGTGRSNSGNWLRSPVLIGSVGAGVMILVVGLWGLSGTGSAKLGDESPQASRIAKNAGPADSAEEDSSRVESAAETGMPSEDVVDWTKVDHPLQPHSGSVRLPVGQPIDLLRMVKLPEHVFLGKWNRSGGAVVSEPLRMDSRFFAPVAIQGSYRIDCKFMRSSGDRNAAVGIVFPVGAISTALMIDGWHGLVGFRDVDAKRPDQRRGTASCVWRPKGTIANGKVHELTIDVKVSGRDVTLNSVLDGKPLLVWRGDLLRLSLPPEYSLPNRRTIGVFAYGTVTEVRSLELTLHEGEAYQLDDNDWKNPLAEVADGPPTEVLSQCQEWNGRKYFFGPSPIVFNSALFMASNMKGRLLTISSLEEAEFIRTQAKGRSFWLSARRMPDSTIWHDERNRPLAWLPPWIPGEPNNERGLQNLLHYPLRGQGLDDVDVFAKCHACIEWGEESALGFRPSGLSDAMAILPSVATVPAAPPPEVAKETPEPELPPEVASAKAFFLGRLASERAKLAKQLDRLAGLAEAGKQVTEEKLPVDSLKLLGSRLRQDMAELETNWRVPFTQPIREAAWRYVSECSEARAAYKGVLERTIAKTPYASNIPHSVGMRKERELISVPWVLSKWEFTRGSSRPKIWEFRADGTVSGEAGDAPKWSRKGDRLIVVGRDGIESLEIDQSGLSITGKKQFGQARTGRRLD